jgi:hypothetical protein
MPDGIRDKCMVESVVSGQLSVVVLGLWPLDFGLLTLDSGLWTWAMNQDSTTKLKVRGTKLPLNLKKRKPAAEHRLLAAGFGFFRALI